MEALGLISTILGVGKDTLPELMFRWSATKHAILSITKPFLKAVWMIGINK